MRAGDTVCRSPSRTHLSACTRVSRILLCSAAACLCCCLSARSDVCADSVCRGRGRLVVRPHVPRRVLQLLPEQPAGEREFFPEVCGSETGRGGPLVFLSARVSPCSVTGRYWQCFPGWGKCASSVLLLPCTLQFDGGFFFCLSSEELCYVANPQ
ncbi:hypothetical protein NDU88_000986 [Pleurodeles waltl]|uniref:Secreted protein n=1 Tax=Pleurodeles waltl TaxID=8319 RepID=A0AAV7LWB1_PLEWA|nr:hypothetical protein NDU88_000986 [Pleurodeles waltl]